MYRFDQYELNERLLELRRCGRVVELQAKPFSLLLYTVRHADRVVSSGELLSEVWSDASVTMGSIRTALYQLRQALDDTGPRKRYIATLHGRGYRFVAEVEAATALRPFRSPAPGSMRAANASAAGAPAAICAT